MPAMDELGAVLRTLDGTRLDGGERDLYTVSLDVSTSGDGRPFARTVLRTMLGETMHAEWDKDEDLVGWVDQVGEAIEEASQAGDRGLLVVGAPGLGTVAQAHTPLPFRNTVHRGPLPWLFEFERVRYLADRPVIVALVDHRQVDLYRIRHAATTAEEHLGGDSFEAFEREKHSGQTDRMGQTFGGQGWTGGHGKERIEQHVEAHRELFRNDAAAKIAELAGPDDLLLIAGPDEPRAELINALTPELQVRAEGLPEQRLIQERDIVAMATERAVARQIEVASTLARDVMSGAYGDRGARGRAEVRRAVDDRRLDTLGLHQDAVSHYGTADDARLHEGAGDDDALGALLRDALEQGAEVRFADDQQLLEQQEGVIGITRW